MSLSDDVQNALLDLMSLEIFGRQLLVNGSPLVAIWAPEQNDEAGQFAGQIVERFRLTCEKVEFDAKVGQELEIDGIFWQVVSSRNLPIMTDITCQRYSA